MVNRTDRDLVSPIVQDILEGGHTAAHHIRQFSHASCRQQFGDLFLSLIHGCQKSNPARSSLSPQRPGMIRDEWHWRPAADLHFRSEKTRTLLKRLGTETAYLAPNPPTSRNRHAHPGKRQSVPPVSDRSECVNSGGRDSGRTVHTSSTTDSMLFPVGFDPHHAGTSPRNRFGINFTSSAIGS